MSYVAVVKALYDYEAQDPQEEISFKEDQVLYVIDKEDDQWWKAKLRPEDEAEEKVGLIPANYVEEAQPISHSRVLYTYASTSEDEISVEEENVLSVYEHQGEWDLVKVIHPTEGTSIGFVPANYTEALQPGEAEDLGLAKGRLEEGGLAKEVDPEEPMSPGVGTSGSGIPLAPPMPAEWATPAERVSNSHQPRSGGSVEPVKDEVETWAISELDKKGKKKKGTLGVGNGAIFFASEADKTPVQQFPIDSLLMFSAPSSKTLLFQFATAPEPLQFHCRDKSTTDAIMAKIRQSKEIAAGGGGGTTTASPVADNGSAAARGVRFTETPATSFPPPPRRAASSTADIPKVAAAPAAASSVMKATALYDFEAQGEDELTIADGEELIVVEKENDDWWTVKNARGQQGVVPAQYVELSASGAVAAAAGMVPAAVDSDDESVDDGAAAREAEQRERERREAEAEAEEERRREEDERRRREEKEKRRAERDRKRREEEAARRREAARQAPPPEPPKLKQRPSANDVAAARNLSIPKGRDAPDRPRGGDSAGGKNRPNPARTRVWHDKSGQFRVEAEFLGMGNGKIRLHKLNGVVIEVPLEKMSPEDVAYLKKVTRKDKERSRPSRDLEDDMPLAQVVQSRSAAPSTETRARMTPPDILPPPGNPPPAAQQQAFRPKRSTFDWFEFFLNAGCDMDDCTRYAGNFEKDRIDESILPELDPGTLRSLGLREGDVIRVKKAISAKFRKHTPEEMDQIRKDEELAKQLQEEEARGGGGRSSPATNLFTGPDGKLANNTRRGRPERKGTISSVDPSSIAAASDQLSRKPSPPLLAPSPPPPPPAAPEPPKPAPLLSGFDDDAWTVKPEVPKSVTPQPPAASAPAPPLAPVVAPTPQQTSQSLSNQVNNLSLNNTGGQNDIFSQIPQNRIVSPNATGQAMPQSYHNGLGMGSSNMTMGQIQQQQQQHQQQQQQQHQQQQQQQQPGPLVPIPANQGLLNPLIPTTTGFSGFVPTRQPLNNQQTGMLPQQTGMMGQQTGMMAQQTGMGMMSQPTGYGSGMSMMPQQTGYMGGMGQQQQGYQNMQPQMTGYNPMQQQQNAMFSQLSAIPPQKTGMPQTEQTKFDPANIFAKMKRGDGASPGPGGAPAQSADKYDALRPQATGLMPLTTGYNGAMMPQQIGMGMMPQQTGYNMGGMGMNMGMGGQNPMYMQQQQQQQQNGFMGRQGGYGY